MRFKREDLIAEIGEKRLINDFIRPLFDGAYSMPAIGNDTALVQVPLGCDVLISTDRVPADLIAYRLGILPSYDLGRYLAALNLSDIAASGGEPVGLLLNMGVPGFLTFGEFSDICRGFKTMAVEHKTRVIGGDITSAGELSLSATSVGLVEHGKALLRSGARPGDAIFTSRPIGLTPAAFRFFLSGVQSKELEDMRSVLVRQFSEVTPLITLGLALKGSKLCTACVDNTDGYSDSLYEIARESGVSMIIEEDRLDLPEMVYRIAKWFGEDAVQLAFGPGADFGLVGTLSSGERASFGDVCPSVKIIGYVSEGNGVYLESEGRRRSLENRGWDYFVNEPTKSKK